MQKKLSTTIVLLIIVVLSASCNGHDNTTSIEGAYDVKITVGDVVFDAKFYDNASSKAIVDNMPFSLNMNDYAKQEKVADLTFSLPTASTIRPAKINVGDIYLWAGNRLVIFYTEFSNSHSYIPLGYIENTDDLVNELGAGNIRLKIEKSPEKY